MEKLTAEQIIEKLKVIYDKVDDFAEENNNYKLEDYPEAVKARQDRKNFYELNSVKHIWNSPEALKEYSLLPNEYTIAQDLWKKSLDLNWKEVHQQGGEGEGDHWESVKYFPDHDVYLRVTGYYASYDGTTFNGWSDCKEVKPVQKTITVYE